MLAFTSNPVSVVVFSINEDESTSQVITGFEFDNAVVRSFDALVSIEIDADTNLFEVIKIYGINKDGVWTISRFPLDGDNVGDDTNVNLTIATATGEGQMRYTSATYTGFTSGTIRFRAVTTSV